MAQKLPKMAQKLAPAKKIAEIYLQYLPLFASLGYSKLNQKVGSWALNRKRAGLFGIVSKMGLQVKSQIGAFLNKV